MLTLLWRFWGWCRSKHVETALAVLGMVPSKHVETALAVLGMVPEHARSNCAGGFGDGAGHGEGSAWV